MSENDPLELLLAVAEKEFQKIDSASALQEINLFGEVQQTNNCEHKIDSTSIHQGDTDSSDDEGNRNFENQKYTDCGKQIKELLTQENPSISSSHYGQPKQRISTWKTKPQSFAGKKLEKLESKPQDVLIDPFFGIRIVNPLISSSTLQEKMEGREAVKFSAISRYIMGETKQKDWVICGVVVSKSPVKTSQKGSQYSIWTLSDLKDDIKTVALFMFSSAHKTLWKSALGTVIGVLNPNVLERRENSKDEATLSVDNAHKVMVFGQSKDFGLCKSMKKNGDRCNAIVNLSQCEFCIYHIKQEYQKCSKRSELQANFSGKGLLALRNKVLGKNEVFYAGKSYTAIPARKSRKMELRDEGILKNLNGNGVACPLKNVKPKKTGHAVRLDVSPAQRLKDIELLRKLGGSVGLEEKTNFSGTHSTDVSLESSKATALDVISRLKAKKVQAGSCESNSIEKDPPNGERNDKQAVHKGDVVIACRDIFSNSKLGVPRLSGFGGSIDLSIPLVPKRANKAKLNALDYIKKNGPIKKLDPNGTKGSGKKRPVDTIDDEGPSKKSKLEQSEFISDRFKKMMAATSKHMDLVEEHDNEEREKYFRKLEIKEKMEEKMVNTQKIACKAVKCLKCKYTSFSASDLCKAEKHPLKVFDALKRFYMCGQCQNRTVTLDIVPTKQCANCGSSKWQKTGMMKEKLAVTQHSLSIRGGEQKFVNSVACDANLDLLVPDDGC
ncbi:protein MCM10 homolog [Cylas formicarius]|uniref:protein MCM10 homolog n=1 Tax=Cylas formicarius TaxID=197179 RepID=UPI0029583955|nr:protein MCM10 homolog [Cylas formicarius]